MKPMKNQILSFVFAGLALGACSALAGESHWNGGRTVPVHKLAPKDAAGDKVSPGDRLPKAISQVQTCGQCHDVKSMAGGSHFRTGLDTNDVPPQVNFEPWFLVDEKQGLVTALSLCGLPGTNFRVVFGMTVW